MITLETFEPLDADADKTFLSGIRLRFSPDKMSVEVMKSNEFDIYVAATFQIEEVIQALEFQGLAKRK